MLPLGTEMLPLLLAVPLVALYMAQTQPVVLVLYLACRAGESCAPKEARRLMAIDFASVDQQLLQGSRRSGQSTPAVVLVGPSDTPKDLEPFRHSLGAGWSPSVIFVEPNPSTCEALREQFRDESRMRPTVVNAVVSTGGESSVHFWMFSRQILERFPSMNMEKLWWDSSTDRHTLVDSHYRNWWIRFERHGQDFSTSDWKSMLSFIEEVSVAAIAPQALLELANTTVADVQVLLVDAEGADLLVVDAFLALGSSFAPELIKFEVITGVNDAGIDELTTRLSHRGFDIFLDWPLGSRVFDVWAFARRT